MTSEQQVEKVLEVLEARVRLYQSRMSTELRVKHDLRAKQLAIVAQENDLLSCLEERSTEAPILFRYSKIRLKKLLDDQRNLQPVLAKAAIQRSLVQDHLTAALRQKLATECQLKRRESDLILPQSRAELEHTLFEMQKCR